MLSCRHIVYVVYVVMSTYFVCAMWPLKVVQNEFYCSFEVTIDLCVSISKQDTWTYIIFLFNYILGPSLP